LIAEPQTCGPIRSITCAIKGTAAKLDEGLAPADAAPAPPARITPAGLFAPPVTSPCSIVGAFRVWFTDADPHHDAQLNCIPTATRSNPATDAVKGPSR
jgi:hypothetical protein